MTNALSIQQHTPTVELLPAGASGNRLSRLQEFERWLGQTGRTWIEPDLADFQRYLLGRNETREVGTYRRTTGDYEQGEPIVQHYAPLSARSVQSYVSTVRGRYQQLLDSNATRDALYAWAGAELERLGQPDTPVDRKAIVDETLTRLANAVKPSDEDVKPIARQDRTDEDVGLRLTRAQADALLASPGLVPIDRLRDTAMLAVFLCTGIREAELANLQVGDLRQTVDGKLCLQVRKGKGAKQRCVPYGALEWCLAYVDKWLEAAGIEAGPVFRGFYKPRTDGTRKMRKGKLSTRAVQKIVDSYPVMVDGKRTAVHAHDLRRTYARRLYDEGMPIKAISENLGHADIRTTIGYIGAESVEERMPPSLYSPPHWTELGELKVQGRLVGEQDSA